MSGSLAEGNINSTKKKEGQGLFLIFIMAILGLLTIFVETMLVPGLPNIAEGFLVGPSDLAWVLTAYTLAGAISIPIIGKLGEMYGRKRMLLAVMIVYMSGLVLAALSWDLSVLIVSRAVQGVGMGAVPLLMGMAKDVLPPRMVPVGMGLISAMMGVGAGLGLVGGGLLISFIGWKDSFWVVLPVTLLMTLIVENAVPEKQVKRQAKLDTVGSALLGAALLSLLLVLSQGSVWGWTSLMALGLALISVMLFVLFVLWERRHSEPMVDLKLLRNRNISSAYLSIFFIGLVMFMLFQTLPFFLEMPKELGGFGITSQVVIGLFMLPNAITQLIFSPLGGRLGLRIGHSKILVIGFVITALGLLTLVFLSFSQVGILLSITIFGAGLGLATVGNTNVLASSCTRETFGSATAVNSTILTIGMSTGPVIASLVIGSFGDPVTGYAITWVLAALLALAAIAALLLNKLDLRTKAPHPTADDGM